MFDFLFRKRNKQKLANMKFKLIVSYTTRPMRDYETNGIQHKFISDQHAESILMNCKPAAYTEIGRYKYFVLADQLIDKSNNLYIIDPKGFNYLRKNYKDIRNFIVIYVKATNDTRNKRAESRPGYNEAIYKERVRAENSQFTCFEDDIDIMNIAKQQVYIVFNDSDNIEDTMKQVDKILLKTYTENTMYLVIGRTCSGKDTICNKLVERNKNE